MRKEKDPPEYELEDSISMVAEITCSKCEISDDNHFVDDSMEAAKDFYIDGWRATDRHTYCPSCAYKFLKKKNPIKKKK